MEPSFIESATSYEENPYNIQPFPFAYIVLYLGQKQMLEKHLMICVMIRFMVKKNN